MSSGPCRAGAWDVRVPAAQQGNADLHESAALHKPRFSSCGYWVRYLMGRMTEGVRWLFYLWWDGYKCVSRLQPGRQPPQLPALLSYSDCRNHTLISGFLPGALNSSFSAPNTKWLFAFISQTIALALPRFYPIWLFLTLWKLQWWRMLQQFSVLFLFPAVPISLLNSIMNEFTGAFLLLSFSCLKGAVFWSMRQMIEKQGELKFTFFSPCLAEYD